MVTNRGAEPQDINPAEIIDKNNGVRNPGIHRVDFVGFPVDLKGVAKTEVKRFAKLNANIFAEELRFDRSGNGLERGRFKRAAFELVHKAGKASRTVAAHFGFAAVRVVVAHPVIGSILRRLDCEKPVCSDSTLTLADFFNLFAGQVERVVTVIDNNEIVAGTVHFRKR